MTHFMRGNITCTLSSTNRKLNVLGKNLDWRKDTCDEKPEFLAIRTLLVQLNNEETLTE